MWSIFNLIIKMYINYIVWLGFPKKYVMSLGESTIIRIDFFIAPINQAGSFSLLGQQNSKNPLICCGTPR